MNVDISLQLSGKLGELDQIHYFCYLLSEGIRVNGIGLMLFIAVPIAFVDLPEEEVRKLSLRARLRILCGGVWHNIILGLFTITIIVALPYLLGPLYRIDQGVEVVGSTQV